MSFEKVNTAENDTEPDKVADIEGKPVQKTLVRSPPNLLTLICPIEWNLRGEEGNFLLRAIRIWPFQQQWLRHDRSRSWHAVDWFQQREADAFILAVSDKSC